MVAVQQDLLTDVTCWREFLQL